MRAYRPTSAIALIAIVVAAGCGSGDDGDGTSTAAAPAATGTTTAAEPAAGTTTAVAPATVGTGAGPATTRPLQQQAARLQPLGDIEAKVAAVGAELATRTGTVAGGAAGRCRKLRDGDGHPHERPEEDVGAPPTPDGEEAKAQVDQLSDDLNSGVDKIKSDTANVSDAASFATAAAAVAATATTMAGQITSTVSALRSLDANGDWEKAFSQAPSCDSMGGS